MTQPKRTHLDALGLCRALRDRLTDFAIDDHFTRDVRLSSLCREIWSGPPKYGGLIGDMWVEGAFPAQSTTDKLSDLSQVFCPELAHHLAKVEAMPADRTLYTHQVEAIRAAINTSSDGGRPALVVTAGTGTGKTESFLLPLLNDLYSHEVGDQGIRCLILYPMNALVNDQADRLYGWLKGQRRVTLFHFTSETPEDADAAERLGVPRWAQCRMRTRQEARGLETHDGESVEGEVVGRQPDVIITNYSMLEYMLCRPQDAIFFGPALRSVVLDEAHLYTGTLAAEITLLLRRLYTRCGVDPGRVLQIATSATLGARDQGELRQFAAQLFSKQVDAVSLIEGKKARVELGTEMPPSRQPEPSSLNAAAWLDRPLLVADPKGELSMARARKSVAVCVNRSLCLLQPNSR